MVRGKLDIIRPISWLVFCVFTTVPGFSYGTYSDVTSDDNYVFGYGVTNVVDYTFQHTATVQVVLRSPNGRSSSDYRQWPNSVTGNASLAWDDGDLGTYIVDSTHWGYCMAMGYFLNGVTTSSSELMGRSVTCMQLVTGTCSVGPIGTTCTYQQIPGCDVFCPVQTAVITITGVYNIANAPPRQALGKRWSKPLGGSEPPHLIAVPLEDAVQSLAELICYVDPQLKQRVNAILRSYHLTLTLDEESGASAK